MTTFRPGLHRTGLTTALRQTQQRILHILQLLFLLLNSLLLPQLQRTTSPDRKQAILLLLHPVFPTASRKAGDDDESERAEQTRDSETLTGSRVVLLKAPVGKKDRILKNWKSMTQTPSLIVSQHLVDALDQTWQPFLLIWASQALRRTLVTLTHVPPSVTD